MRLNSLSAPVGALMRPTLRIDKVDSLGLAAARLRENGAGILPVVDGEKLVGIVTEASLGEVLAAAQEPTDPTEDAMVEASTIKPYETGAEALRRFVDEREGPLVVIDDLERVMGLIAPSDLWPKRRANLRPPAVGGMATPFGVYLTTGTVSGGVHPLALVTTGMSMSALLIGGTMLAIWLADLLVRHHMPASWAEPVAGVLSLVLFFALMRAVPMAGIHGAEHQVVHAIEREEELVPSIVSRMPRVHPRCGTNFAAGLLVFLPVFRFVFQQTNQEELAVLAGGLTALLLWKRIGSFLQYWITTRKPNEKQLASGIRAGEQLLENYAASHLAYPSVLQRLWRSGFFHVLAGAALMAILFTLASQALGLGYVELSAW